MEDEHIAEFAEVGIQALIRFVVAGERVRAIMPIVKLAAEELGALGEVDPELAPEILAAMDRLQEANDTIARAFEFASARMNAKLENL